MPSPLTRSLPPARSLPPPAFAQLVRLLRKVIDTDPIIIARPKASRGRFDHLADAVNLACPTSGALQRFDLCG